MKKIYLFFVLFFACLNLINAQQGNPLNQSGNQSVLINDTHAESIKLANAKLTEIPVSVTKIIVDLTPKQLRYIVKVEACRDKKLKQIENRMIIQKQTLSTLESASPKNLRLITKTIDNISKLAIDYQKNAAKATRKIHSKLTEQQKNKIQQLH